MRLTFLSSGSERRAGGTGLVGSALLLALTAGCSGSPNESKDFETSHEDLAIPPDLGPRPPADWVVSIDPESSAGTLSPALLGQYDLSGALFAYDKVPGLVKAMEPAGMAEWRIGAGRWEITTQLLPTLTDGTSCAADLAPFPAASLAPPNATDLDLLKTRDWFTYTDGTPVTEPMTADDSRYSLAYLRSAIDTATAFAAEPYVDIDLMPRALSAGTTPARVKAVLPDACLASFTNHVSNACPADPQIFAAAVAGLVQRIVEGSNGEKGRPVTRWEIWNEPEFPYFWDKSYEPMPGLDEFFKMAVFTLVRLDAYRKASKHPSAPNLRFGLGSFATAATAASVLTAFEANPLGGNQWVPADFVSFHAYDNDPLAIADAIQKVADARKAAPHYKTAELVLAEWGLQLDGVGWDPKSMDAPLHAATVIALGAAAGLDRAHHAIFYDFYDGVPFGLIDHQGQPSPLFHAYALLAPLVAGGAVRLPQTGFDDGRYDSGMGAVLASRDRFAKVHVLFVNRGPDPRTARVDYPRGVAIPLKVLRFSDPAQPPVLIPVTSLVIDLPPRSIVLVEY